MGAQSVIAVLTASVGISVLAVLADRRILSPRLFGSLAVLLSACATAAAVAEGGCRV